MRTIELPWETWRAIIAALRDKALLSKLEHAERLEQLLDQVRRLRTALCETRSGDPVSAQVCSALQNPSDPQAVPEN